MLCMRNEMISACAKLEHELGEGHELIGGMKLHFRESVEPWFSQSFLMSRGLNKPNGHPGDYKTLEAIYDNQLISSGIGKYLDQYFLNAPLAIAVRNRKDRMRDIVFDFINDGIKKACSVYNTRGNAFCK